MSSPSDSAPHGRAMAAAAFATILFSWGFIIVKVVGLPPATISFWRLLIGAAVLSAAAVLSKTPWPRAYGLTLLAGLCFGAHQLAFIAATQQTSVAVVTLVAAQQPLVVGALSMRVVGEKVPMSLWIWTALGIAGVTLVVLSNASDPSRSLMGDLLALINLPLMVAFFLVSKRARQQRVPTLTWTASTLWAATLVVGPSLLGWNDRWPNEPVQWALIAALALGPGSGHLFVNWAHRYTSATVLSLMLAAVPVLAGLWAHWLLSEPFGWTHWTGAMLTIAAVVGARRAELRQLTPRRRS